MRPASVDVGSNTVRMLVAQPNDGPGFQVIDRSQAITRLGEGMGGSKRLKSAAIKRTIDELSRFRERFETLGVTAIRAVATSAVRDSENAADFIGEAARAGIEIEIITGAQEARLVMDGIAETMRVHGDNCVVIDIGGGSTEFIRSCEGNDADIISSDLGVVRLTERFLPSDPPTATEIDVFLNFLENRIDLIYNRFTVAGPPACLTGTAGTVTTLAAVDLDLELYDPDIVEGHLLSYDRVVFFLREFLAVTGEERLAHYPVMTRGRQDLIVAGTIIIKTVMERFGIDRMIVSDRGLLEGIIMGMIGSRQMASDFA